MLHVGTGVFTFADGSTYDGSWTSLGPDGVEMKHGNGVFVRGRERYEGEWKEDVMEGSGVQVFASGARYEGGGRGICTVERVFTLGWTGAAVRAASENARSKRRSGRRRIARLKAERKAEKIELLNQKKLVQKEREINVTLQREVGNPVNVIAGATAYLLDTLKAELSSAIECELSDCGRRSPRSKGGGEVGRVVQPWVRV